MVEVGVGVEVEAEFMVDVWVDVWVDVGVEVGGGSKFGLAKFRVEVEDL